MGAGAGDEGWGAETGAAVGCAAGEAAAEAADESVAPLAQAAMDKSPSKTRAMRFEQGLGMKESYRKHPPTVKVWPFHGMLANLSRHAAISWGQHMKDLRDVVVDVPDFPKQGILFRDIAPLLRTRFADTMQALDALFTAEEWKQIDAIAGIESRGFILGAALALQRGKGFVLIRKKGKLPPPVVDVAYDLEYGSGVLEMQRGEGRLLLVDDVLATGGTLTAAAELCLKAGYEVTSLGALIDLHIIADYRWRGMPLRAVIHY